MIPDIGAIAGKIWQIIDEQNGQMSYLDLKELFSFSEQELLLAIGWLSREDKIFIYETKKSFWMLQLIY
jgi:hypothetical protein